MFPIGSFGSDDLW